LIDELAEMGSSPTAATVFGWMSSYWPNVATMPDPLERGITTALSMVGA
jgi:hypothetical protein